jgi:hypothetical protein
MGEKCGIVSALCHVTLYLYLSAMRTQNPRTPDSPPVLTIDLSKWTTVTQYAREHDLKPNTVTQRVKRSIEGKTINPLELWHIPELGITLIRRNG